MITTEIIYQHIFLASIVLMALSFPKIMIIFFWSLYRIRFYETLAKIPKKSFYGKSIRNVSPEYMIDKFKDEKQIMTQTSKEVKRATESLKIPMTEAISSVILMIISLQLLEFESDAFNIVILLIILLLFSFILGAYYILRYISKVKPFLEKHKEENSKSSKIKQNIDH